MMFVDLSYVNFKVCRWSGQEVVRGQESGSDWAFCIIFYNDSLFSAYIYILT